MSWGRRLWFAVAMVGILGAVSVFLGAVYGGAGLTVASMNATGETPTNQTANCEDTVVRTVDLTVRIEREGLSFRNPQWWHVGVRVRATVFEVPKQRTAAIAPGGEQTVVVPFTAVQDGQSAPPADVSVIVQVTKGQAELAMETLTANVKPVTAGRDC
jgi:hypothetical protein